MFISTKKDLGGIRVPQSMYNENIHKVSLMSIIESYSSVGGKESLELSSPTLSSEQVHLEQVAPDLVHLSCEYLQG